MINVSFTKRGAAFVWAGFLVATAPLHGQHSDIAIYQDASGKITTHNSAGQQSESRVFRRNFDFFNSPIFAGDDPGILMTGQNPPAGFSALPPASELNLNLIPLHIPGQAVGNLLFWDGTTTEVEFTALPANHLLFLEDATGVTEIALDGSLQRHDGLVAGVTDGMGGMHEHLTYALENNGSAPSVGFYLMGWEFALDGLETARHVLVALNPTFVPAEVQDQLTNWLEDHLTSIRLAGDFDDNGAYELPDVDSLVAAIASGANATEFDLTLDGLVNVDDLDLWRAVAGAALNESGGPVLEGDANLDGIVDGLDFVAWNTSKFTSNAAWSAGDFTADGLVDGRDFIVWNQNKFQAADASGGVVPEPAGGALVLTTVGTLLFLRRNRGVNRVIQR